MRGADYVLGFVDGVKWWVEKPISNTVSGFRPVGESLGLRYSRAGYRIAPIPLNWLLRILREAHWRAIIGPRSSRCPCCGKRYREGSSNDFKL